MGEFFNKGYLRQPLLLVSVMSITFLFFITLVLMVFYLRKSDIVNCHLFAAQRIALFTDREAEVRSGFKPPAGLVENSASESWDSLTAMHLLDKGGLIAGLYTPAIENSEISLLLNSIISLHRARKNKQPTTSAYVLLTHDYRKKVEVFLEALAFQAISAKRRVWIVFCWLGLWAGLLLVTGFFGCRMLWVREKRLRRESRSYKFFEDLLQDYPEAFIVLEEDLSLKLVNRQAERFFGRQSAAREKVYFGRFCQEQLLLESLRNSFLEFSSRASEKFFSNSQVVPLKQGQGRERLVKIQWSKISPAGSSYLLGVLKDLEDVQLSDLNLVIAQKRLKELTNNLFQAQDEERRHLADELHDGLCQSLAALKMQVFSVERHVDKIELQEECRKARQFIAQIIEDVRRLSHDLSPVILDDLGLSDALAHLVNNFTALNNLKASIVVPDLDDIFAGDAARNIYRIVQEAINNVGKHAKASLILLEAEIIGDEVRFSIKDDGVGFDMNIAQKGRPGAGLGLASMGSASSSFGR